MSTVSANDDPVTFDQAAEAFRGKYPNWRDSQSFSRVFSKLEDLTRIDSEKTSEPEKVFMCLLDQSKIPFTEVDQYTGRLDLQDWFVILAFFADCDVSAFSGRFNRMISKSSGKRIPLHQLKSQLVKSVEGTLDESVSLGMFDLTEHEQSFLKHCINSVDPEAATVQVDKDDNKGREYKVVGKAGPFTRQAAKVISCSYEKIYEVRKALSGREFLWIKGGKKSREKGKRIAVWKMLL